MKSEAMEQLYDLSLDIASINRQLYEEKIKAEQEEIERQLLIKEAERNAEDSKLENQWKKCNTAKCL